VLINLQLNRFLKLFRNSVDGLKTASEHAVQPASTGMSPSHFVTGIVGFSFSDPQQNNWPCGGDSNSTGVPHFASSFAM